MIYWCFAVTVLHEYAEIHKSTIDGYHKLILSTCLYDATNLCVLWPQMVNVEVNNVFYQQDGAICDTAHGTITLFCGKLPGSDTSQNGDVN